MLSPAQDELAVEEFDRVAMHAVRVDVLEAQADALGLPLWQIPIPSPCSNERYERAGFLAGTES